MNCHFISKFTGTKREIGFCCAGIVLGTIAGIAIGLMMSEKKTEFRYMQAVQCCNYEGTEVFFDIRYTLD